MQLALQPLDPAFADLVVSWVRDEQELLWLAPRSQWPLTPDKVRAWKGPRNTLYQLAIEGHADPIGYGEINRMPNDRRRYWLGHVILDPRARNRGAGAAFVNLLMREAFGRLNARTLSLVVLPDNEAAIRCYARVGFVHTRDEIHRFHADRKLKVARMDLMRDQWLTSVESTRTRPASPQSVG